MFVSRRRILVSLAALLLFGALEVPATHAGVSPGFVVGIVNRIRRWNRRKDQRRRHRARVQLRADVEAALERMKSRFPDQRREGLDEMLAWARQHEEGEIRLEHPERIGVVLEQLLRDPSLRMRIDAQEARLRLGLTDPEELDQESEERLAKLREAVGSAPSAEAPTSEEIRATVPPPPRWLIGDGEPGADALY